MTNSSNKNKERKQNARRKNEAATNRKLQADADFFWDCVSKQNNGTDIAGGKKWHRPSKLELFGDKKKESEKKVKVAEAKVIRSGGATDVAKMDKFDSLGLLPDFVRKNLIGKDRMRYTKPTPVQSHCVPLALEGHDVLASAQTGSGKTIAFLLPLIESVAKNRKNNKEKKIASPSSPAALILAPTRELAIQIELEIEKLTFGAPTSKNQARWSTCCYGGAPARPQLEALASGVEILVATPGRLVDFLDRKLVSLSRCKFLVLDEADRMLDMGFEPQLNKIVEKSDMPKRENRHTLLFSATFPKPLQIVAEKSYLRKNFAKIAVGQVGASNKSVEQRIIKIEGNGTKRDKIDVLLPLLQQSKRGSTIVFAGKKHVAHWITKELGRKSIKCSQIHGDRTQGQREAALSQFRDGKVDVLVATDAVARGIDIPDVAHVIQFDLPFGVKEFESYTHRIGRTGRAGKTGFATAFYVPGNQPKVGNAELLPLIRTSFEQSKMELPEWFHKENNGGKQKKSNTARSQINTKHERPGSGKKVVQNEGKQKKPNTGRSQTNTKPEQPVDGSVKKAVRSSRKTKSVAASGKPEQQENGKKVVNTTKKTKPVVGNASIKQEQKVGGKKAVRKPKTTKPEPENASKEQQGNVSVKKAAPRKTRSVATKKKRGILQQ